MMETPGVDYLNVPPQGKSCNIGKSLIVGLRNKQRAKM